MKKKIILSVIAVIVTAVIAVTIYGNVVIECTDYTVSDKKIPASFDGFRIVVLSDIHDKKYGKDNIRLTDLVKEKEPDIIAITGDLVDSEKSDIEAAGNLVKKLTDIAPVYYVTGNHESWLGDRYNELENILLNAGATVLHNKSVTLTQGGQSLLLAGLDDPDFSYWEPSIRENVLGEKSDKSDYLILLSHRPEKFKTYVSESADLVLCGHTHGGQIRLPFIGGIIAPDQGLFPEYVSGRYTEGNTTMIISRGLGNSIVPFRFNNNPEIVTVILTQNSQ